MSGATLTQNGDDDITTLPVTTTCNSLSQEMESGLDREPSIGELNGDVRDGTDGYNSDSDYEYDEISDVIDQHRYRQKSSQIKNEHSNATGIPGKNASVTYSVRVYDASTNLHQTIQDDCKPSTVYVDSVPMKVMDFNSELDYETINNFEVVPDEERTKLRQRAKVMEIEVLVHAPIPRKYPKLVENLFVKRVSQYQMIIKSRPLYTSLMKLIEYFPSFRKSDLTVGSRNHHIVLQEPFAPLIHHFPIIQKFLENDSLTEEQVLSPDHVPSGDDMKGLLVRKQHMRYVYDYIKPIYERVRGPFSTHMGGETPKVLFQDLWLLFKPGLDVYFTQDGIIRRGIVYGVTKLYKENQKNSSPESDTDMGVWRDPNEHPAWSIEVWFLFSNGFRIFRNLAEIPVWAYSGTREVTQLEVCPASIWDERDKGVRCDRVLRRSKFAINALRAGHLLAFYNGPTMSMNYSLGVSEKRHYTGQVVIDQRRGVARLSTRNLLDKDNKDNSLPKGPLEDFSDKFRQWDDISVFSKDSPLNTTKTMYDDLSIDVESLELSRTDSSQLTDHQLLLLDPQLHAFLLKTKNWAIFQADYLSSMAASNASFDRLVLGAGERRTIEAICARHNLKNEQWAADFIAGKGKGQIILLHGPPGVGKTYTVEAIAEKLNLPLIALTLADIGTNEFDADSQLLRWFSLAEAWNAIVLVDEADIFLETREHRDLERNGLVSAFLRRLEYFEGFIALTTNRPGQIDDAFVSRIHVAIRYKPFDAQDRQEIWRGFFKKLVDEKKGKIRVAQEAKNWVLKNAQDNQKQMNGRDIRNALQTAITLAEYGHREAAANDPDFDAADEVIIERSHFEDVLAMLDQFRNDLERIRGEDMSSSAKARRDRDDYLAKTTDIQDAELNFGVR